MQHRTNRMPQRYSQINIKEAEEVDMHFMDAVDAEVTVIKKLEETNNGKDKQISIQEEEVILKITSLF